jgi:hypothetical protein
MGMARCLKKQGRNKELVTLLRSGTCYFRDSADYWTSLAQAHELLGQWQKALHAWDYVAENLHHPIGYVGAAQALEQMHELDEALKRLT